MARPLLEVPTLAALAAAAFLASAGGGAPATGTGPSAGKGPGLRAGVMVVADTKEGAFLAEYVSEMLGMSVGEGGVFRPIAREVIEDRLAASGKGAAACARDDACLQRIAVELRACFLAVGFVSGSGKKAELTLGRFVPFAPRPERLTLETVSGDEGAIIERAPALGERLSKFPPPARLRFTPPSGRTRLLIDGAAVADPPPGGVLFIKPGERELRLEDPGLRAAPLKFRFEPGGRYRLAAETRPR